MSFSQKSYDSEKITLIKKKLTFIKVAHALSWFDEMSPPVKKISHLERAVLGYHHVEASGSFLKKTLDCSRSR